MIIYQTRTLKIKQFFFQQRPLGKLRWGSRPLLCIHYFTVLRIEYYKTPYLNLGPYPDAVEYLAQVNSMLKTGRRQIQIAYDKLSSRYLSLVILF